MSPEPGLDVLVVGGGARQRALARFLSGHARVARVYLATDGGGAGLPKAQRVRLDPTDVAGLAAFVRRRRLALVVEGAGGGGLAQHLRDRASFLVARGGEPLQADLGGFLRSKGGSRAWRLAWSPPPADPHPHVPASPAKQTVRPRRRLRGPLSVLVVGAAGEEGLLCRVLSEDDRVGQIYMTPGRSGGGNPLTRRIPPKPDDLPGLLGFLRRRRVDLVVEGPDAAQLGEHLRARASYVVHGPATRDPLAAAVWRLLRRRRRGRGWRVLSPPAAAQPVPTFQPVRFECERDHVYVLSVPEPER